MSSIVLASGIVRAVRPLAYGRSHERAGQVFGIEASIMTSIGDVLGETLKVAAFDRDGQPTWNPEPGESTSVIVEVEAGRFGLSGTFQRLATADDVKTLPFGVPTFAGTDTK